MDIAGIGLANIDLVAYVDDAFLSAHRVQKGKAAKVDELSFARLRGALEAFDAIPGGCMANTMCGMAAYGVSAAFFGKIGDDSFQSLFRSSFAEYTVHYTVEGGQQESSQCAVLVTPDGERSFAYTHGASWDLEDKDLDEDILKQCAMICAEIYAFEFGTDGSVMRKIVDISERHRIPIVMKVMDQDFARRYAPKIQAMAQAGILLLIAGNDVNLPALTGAKDADEALTILSAWPCDILMTRNRNGVHFISDGKLQHFAVEPVLKPKNTTGAGDQFLAGFLTGRLDGRNVEECVAHGAACARTILMHDGARPPLVNRHSIRF